MSSLKDIMDVDVEPLESQAYRRKEAAQQQASRPSLDPSSQSPSPQLDDNRGKPSVNRRRSNRVSKSATQTTTSRSTIPRRRSSAAAEAMDFSGFQLGGSSQGSIAGSPLQTSSRGGMDQVGDVPVKYTPVTGRISRAKKGIPVHTCEDCKPAKTFTRAEHLRRHKLSHGKPAYPCTFEDCERTFHRSDLLARHLNRHETQGEKAYKASDPRSRASSSASESAPLKLEPAPHGIVPAGVNQMAPSDSMTPRTTTSSDSGVTATSFNTITSNFQAVNFSPGGSQSRSAPQSTLTDADVYTPSSTGAPSSRMPSSYNDMTSRFPMRPMPEIPDQDSYSGSVSSFPTLYSDGSASFTGYSAQHALPLLRIPEDPLMPGLSYTQDNSPWCSSASESTYSTHSDSSHIGRMVPRGRSGSLVTAPEWSAVPVSSAHWSPHGMTAAPQDLRSPPYETVMEAYETSYTPPRMSPPTRQLLDVPVGNYYMESVGNPHPSTYYRHFAQNFSASSPRVSDTRLASFDRRSKELVDNQQLGILTNIGTIMAIPTRSAMANIEQYLSAYWENFDKLYPLIHRATFTYDHDSLLTFAMAAIGTQYCYNIEARRHGVELHAYCTKTIPLTLNWTLQTLQAILLTEIFTRFRGKRTAVRLSRQFEEIYHRLLNTPCQMHEPESIAGANLMDSLDRTQDAETEWLQWVDVESRRRLLCLCFIFDIHQAMYHQQSRAKTCSDATNTILYVPCPEFIWESTSAADWDANRNGNHSDQPLHLAQQYLAQENSSELSHFTQTLHICAIVSQLRNHDDPNDPNNAQSHDVQLRISTLETLFPTSPTLYTYLALYHTPLHDLLAVTGDTWVFSSKLKQPSLFIEAQMRLRAWSSSPAAATAVHYACRVLEFALSNSQRASSADPRNGVDHLDLSHYWSLYVAALICWAFGHRVGENTIARFHNDLRPVTDTVIENPSHEASERTRLKALVYAKSMLGLDKVDLLSNKAIMRAQIPHVIDAVRARLQLESVGDHCMMLVDCIGVLKRLRERGRGKLF